MSKKPLVVGLADDVKALDAVARKIVKLLDDNGMWLSSMDVKGGGSVNVIYPANGEGKDGGDLLTDTVMVTVTEDPTVVYQR